ncbi:MFS general substrate transporter [Xylariomycetidae sp. FL2044]|nr:MFS general substrate transporter [Xylariomycetidae sp. FL2044]
MAETEERGAATATRELAPIQPSPPAPVYTAFTKFQRRSLTYLLGYLGLISSLSATIYFPLIPLLADQYHTSVQAVNLSITLYIVFQGLAPSFWSPLSDSLGRRPVFLATFAVFTVASIGLVFSRPHFAVLACLRAVQSIGGSAVLSIAYGVVADLSPPSERGTMLGPMLASGNLGPCLGPVIGGSAIFAGGQSQWCFLVLAALGGSALLLVGWGLPETNRSVVGNGSVEPAAAWRTWWGILRGGRKGNATEPDRVEGEKDIGEAGIPGQRVSYDAAPVGNLPPSLRDHSSTKASGRGSLVCPNPFTSLRLVFYYDTFLILFLAAAPYSVWYLIQTSIPTIYGTSADGYGFNDLGVGLSYLAGGSGVIAGGFIAGRLMDWNYKVVAARAGLPVDRKAGDDVRQFPIEKMRSRTSIRILSVSMCVLVGFGWLNHFKVHPSVPLIFQCFIGMKCTVLHQMYSALLVDIFPECPSTAAASNNIVRCGLSAGLVAALRPLVSALGNGWFFTMVALLDWGLCAVAILSLRRHGWNWRDRRQRR